MLFLIDECVSKKTILLIRKTECKIFTVQDSQIEGQPDSVILETAVSKKLTLITVDKDFGNILIYPPKIHYGIIILKITKETENNIHSLLLNFINTKKNIEKKLVIIDKNKIRIRT